MNEQTKEILIVIDMQSGFLGKNADFYNGNEEYEEFEKNMVSKIIKRIETYQKLNLPILVVEFNGYGPTISPINDKIINYNNVYIVNKYGDNGAHEINAAIKQNELSGHDVELVGVNYDACVIRTARGLKKCGYYVCINKKATNHSLCKMEIKF